MTLESMVVVVFPKRRPHFPIIIGKMIKEKKKKKIMFVNINLCKIIKMIIKGVTYNGN